MLRVIFSAAEALGLMLTLVPLLSFNVTLVFWISLTIFLTSVFVLSTGRSAPRIQSRGKGFVIANVTGVCLLASASIVHDQREEHLAQLRTADPDAYLTS